MNTTDLLIDGIRDHIEAVADTPLSTCAFVIRDQAADRSFPQVRVSERSSDEHDTLLGVYRTSVDVTLRTNPEDTSDSTHQSMSEQLWDLVADEEIEDDLSSVPRLQVHDVRCSGPITEPEDNYRSTVFELTCVHNRAD